jgi:hypothetical protein
MAASADPVGPRFAVRVDEATLAEDLAHATRAGRAAIIEMVDSLRSAGAPNTWLKRCQAEHIDGTDLSGCVKLYIPRPAGARITAHHPSLTYPAR